MNLDSGFQISDLISLFKRRIGVVAGVAGLVFLLVYWVAMALPNQYESYATLLIEPQSVSERLVEPGAENTDLNARLHLMTAQILSRPRLSRLIDELGLYEAESESMLREEVIDLMRSRVRVEPVLPEMDADTRRNRVIEINTFKIFFRSDNPRTAAAVAQRLANDFIEEHIDARVQMTQRSLEFIDAELQRLAGRIVQVEQRIAAVKAENPGRLPEDFAANQRLYERTLAELREAQRSLDLARSDEAFWSNQVLAAADTGAPRDDANPARKLELLELTLAEHRAKGFTEKHPDVIKTQEEIDNIQAHLDSVRARQEDEGVATSFAQQSAQSEARRAKARTAAAQQEIDRLQAQADSIQSRLGATPRVAEQLDALEREYASLKESVDDFGDRQLEASVQASLERRQLGEQFRVLESAFPPPSPSSPNRPLLLAMGLVIGMAAGVGLALLLEAASPGVRSARDLQTMVSIPVLASIPEILLESDRAARRRRQLRNAIAAAAVVLFFLTGGALTYFWVNGAPGWLQPSQEAPAVGALEAPRAPLASQHERGSA